MFCIEKHPIWKSCIGSKLIMTLTFESALRLFQIKVYSISKPTMYELSLVWWDGRSEIIYFQKKDAIKYVKTNWLDTYSSHISTEFIEHQNVDMSKFFMDTNTTPSSSESPPTTSITSPIPLRKLWEKRISLPLRKSVECVTDSDSESQKSPKSPTTPTSLDSKSLLRRSLQFISSPRSRSSPHPSESPHSNASPRSSNNSPRSSNNSPRSSNNSPRSYVSSNNSPRSYVSPRSLDSPRSTESSSLESSGEVERKVSFVEPLVIRSEIQSGIRHGIRHEIQDIDIELSAHPSPQMVLVKK